MEDSTGKLEKRFGELPKTIKPADQVIADQILKEVLDGLQDVGAEDILSELKATPKFTEFLANVFSLSSYLRDCALIDPSVLVEILSTPFPRTLNDICMSARNAWMEVSSEAELMSALRMAKRKLALGLGLADLGGWFEAKDVTRILSEFADAALGSACDYLLYEYHQQEKIVLPNTENPWKDSGLIVLGMGKYGSYELNYSSDIDIILLFDMNAGIEVKSDDPTSLFVRFAKQLNRIIQERTGDGYVFRMDLRLRPDPGSTPLAIPVQAAFNYYEAYGQNWERAAFIKARPVAGDIKSGEKFLEGLVPFIWRKYLDFAAIQDVHSIKRQIHVHKGHGEIAVKGHNIKLGRGGIREIEFFVQTQQLIAGGRRPQLRMKSTIEALNALTQDGWISIEASEAMTQSYWYLRNVEHRIQMVADEQNHTLPDSDEGLTQIAKMMGYDNQTQFTEELTEVMRSVEKHYAGLFESSPELSGKSGSLIFTGDQDDPETLENLASLGFKQPAQIISTIKGWYYGRFPAVQSSQARELLTELTHSLIETFSEADNPDQAFFAFDRFLSGLPAGIQLFSILKSNPNLTRLLIQLLGSAPRLAGIITRKPHIFDGLIDPSFGASIPEKSVIDERLNNALARSPAYEMKLDLARLYAAEQNFLIGIRLVNRTINQSQAGKAFTDLAEVMLEQILKIVRTEFEIKHGKISGGEISIVGMGRLGSRELTAGSDLDLIFLYRHDEDAEASNGEKPLYPQQYFVRLVQRLITAMSAPTAEGILYELDFRLRPSGNSGPLATHLDSFMKYQNEGAWIWERQALTRARAVAGDDKLVAELNIKLNELLSQDSELENVSQEIIKMRKTLDEEKPGKNTFDVKCIEGGIIDIEFISQWGALCEPSLTSSLQDRSTLFLLSALPENRLKQHDKEVLKKAYLLYDSVLQLLRVCSDGEFDPDKDSHGLSRMLCEQAGLPDIAALELELSEAQKEVRAIFNAVLSEVK